MHTLVRVMQCFGSFGMGALGQAHVSGGRSTCELFVARGESQPRGGLGCARGWCPGQIPRVPHQGAGQGVSSVCCCTQGLAQRESRLPAHSVCSPGRSILPFFSCYPFDLYCKQVALTGIYPLQKANVSKGSVNNFLMSVWTAHVLLGFPS